MVIATAKNEYTPARAEANRRYNEKAYAQIAIQVPKDTAQSFKKKCEKENVPQRQVLLKAIENFLGE